MATKSWQTKRLSVTNLHLDAKNPRLGRETSPRAPREIIQYLFEHDKALDVAESIVSRGYFPNEPLLAIVEKGRHVVVEGNRRLAALKALREPTLLEGSLQRQVERLSRRMTDPESISRVPVTVAPNRRATDRQIAGRHIGSPVLAWQAENRASFILEKLAEGYDNEGLRYELGFSLTDIQNARQTKVIVDMARSIELPDDVKAKLDNPRAKVFTTLQRVLESKVGRKYLFLEPDSQHGFRGTTTKREFVRGFRKLIVDVASKKQSSRSLNTNDDIGAYFKQWKAEELPTKKAGTFVPSDVIQGKSIVSAASKSQSLPAPKRAKTESRTVLPRDLKIKHGNDRLVDIHRELTRLKRDEFPNAGAVLLRVFFELSIVHYFQRTGKLSAIVEKIEAKTKGKLPLGVPMMKQLVPEIVSVAKSNLTSSQASLIEKAVTPNASAPFTISDLNAFVHSPDLPGARDIQQFWVRVEPLLRLILEEDQGGSKE